jgi:hypothetical protein
MAILVIFALTVIGSVISMIASMDVKISGNQRMSTEALYAAEAGLSEAVHRMSLINPTVETVGGWTGNIAISDAPPYDPNWKTRIYMTNPGSAPGGKGSNVHTGTILDLKSRKIEYSATSGFEDVLTIEHKWEDRNNNGIRDANEIVLYDPVQVPPENFATGFPVEVVSVTGRHGLGERRIEAETVKLEVLGRSLGALFIDKSVRITGTPDFCGFNHDVAVPNGTNPNACFAWHIGAGALAGVTTTGDSVDIAGSVQVLGSPKPTNTDPANPFYSIEEVLGITTVQLNQILAGGHKTITNPLNGITYINGDATVNANTIGEGLLYVTGHMKVAGGFEYRGLIYVEGDVQFVGDAWILGSMIVRGTKDDSFSAGKAELLYSGEAITRYVGQYFPMIRLSWRER